MFHLILVPYLVCLLYLRVNCHSETMQNIKDTSEVNPDIYLNPTQIIRRHGYMAESHTIETQDGFLLTLHRISRSKNGTIGNQPVFIQHGLFASSICFIEEDENSLAFILSDLGYDVWLGNARGNEFSRGHISLPPSSAQFWNFSWHEMAIFDLPAALDYVVNETNKQGEIIYIGHSMGTTMFLAFASLFPDVAANVKAMVALAPVAYMTHLTSPIRYLAPWVNDIEFISKHMGMNEFLPSSKIVELLAYECLNKHSRKICENILFIIAGLDKDQVKEDTIDVVLSHMPSGTSTKTVLHYLQEISSKGDYKMYDYGKKGNMVEYGQPTPPQYNLESIKVPMYLMYADSDMLANPVDVKRLYARLTKTIGIYEVPLKTFNHIDFLLAKDAPELVYKNLSDTIRNYGLMV